MRFGIDWMKPSNFGRTRAGPPPAWLILAVIAGLGLVLLLAQTR